MRRRKGLRKRHSHRTRIRRQSHRHKTPLLLLHDQKFKKGGHPRKRLAPGKLRHGRQLLHWCMGPCRRIVFSRYRMPVPGITIRVRMLIPLCRDSGDRDDTHVTPRGMHADCEKRSQVTRTHK